MKQVNVDSDYKRNVVREPSWEVVNKSIGAKFLCNNEVVINLKGPSNGVEKVKVQLEEKLKSLLFSKRIPYPPQATLALLSKLKEVSSKHLVTCTVVSSRESGEEASESIQLEGFEVSVMEARGDILELLMRQISTADEVLYPPEWDVMSMMDQVKIVDLEPDSTEYAHVCFMFCLTLLTEEYIIKIQRVQNKPLWERYLQTKRELHKKNAGDTNEKELFHGTRDKPPQVICESAEGFDMRLSSDGMWGRANYFAVNASYSDSYAYYNESEQTNQLILVKVLVGDTYPCRPDSKLRRPPAKKTSSSLGVGQIQEVRYDSVTGTTNGSQVYMTYENKFSYPAYIITYTKVASVAQAAAAQRSIVPPSAPSNNKSKCIIS